MHLAPDMAARWTPAQTLAEKEDRAVLQVVAPDGTPAVLKRAFPHTSPVAMARLRREATLFARLRHPALPELLDAGDRPWPWMVISWIPGRDPRHLWTRPPLAPNRAVHLARQLADVVAYLHHHGVAHRDLKPANLRVDGDRLWVLDLDAAADAGATALTAAGEPHPATPAYAPPEWFDQGGDAAAADVYAIGQILHEWLIGGPAFPRSAALADEKATPLDPVTAPAAIRDWIRRCTDPDPRRRPRALDLAKGLEPSCPPPAWTVTPTLAGDLPGLVERPENLGRYQILGVLGRGGMGVVYRAHDPALHREVALKVMLGASGAHKDRFVHEARALARLRDPGLVAVLDAGDGPDGMWFAMELVNGPDLASWLAEHGPPPPDLALAWVADLARALAVAHGAGIVHRDVKPANILLEPRPDGSLVPRLADFGIALGQGVRDGPVGTPRYMAPEQRRGEPADPRSDLYGLGQVLADLVRGGPGEGLPPTRPDIAGWIARLAAEDPSARPGSAAQVARELQGLKPIPSRRIGFGIPAAVLAGVGLVALGWAGWPIAGPDVGPRLAEMRAERSRTALVVTLADLRARGEEAEAMESLRLFTLAPAHQGTRALAAAWLDEAVHRAERRRATPPDVRPSIQPIEEALASAYAVAHHPDDQRRALASLAVHRAEVGDWGRANAALQVWASLVGEEPDAEARAAMQRFGSAWGAGLPLAWRQARGEHPWATGIRLAPRVEGPAAVIDVDHDGHSDILAFQNPEGPPGHLGWIRAGDPARTWRSIPRPADLPAYAWRSATGSGFDLVTQRAYHGVVEIWRLTPREVSHVGEAPLTPGTLAAVAAGQLRGHAMLGLGTQTGRQLRAAKVDGAGAVWWAPHPATDATRSEVQALAIGDVTGDGTPEVLVGTGPWGAWDLRVFTPNPDDSWDLAARVPHGDVHGLAIWPRRSGLPWIVASTRAAGRRDHQPETPEAGLHLWTWDQSSKLQPGPVVPWPSKCETLFAVPSPEGADLAAGCWAGLLHVGPDLQPHFLPGPSPVGSVDVDLDGRHRVLARVGEGLWALGEGPDRIEDPTPEKVVHPRIPPPGVTDPHAWRRAESLIALGLAEQAADRFLQLAVVAPTGGGGPERLRAGDILLELDHGEQALAAYHAAAADPATRIVALEAGLRAAELELNLEAATQLAASLAAEAPGSASLDRVHALQRSLSSAVHLDPSRPLAGWEVIRPLSLWRDPGVDVVRVRSTEGGVLARHPVHWDGGPVRLSVEMLVRRMEWGQGIAVGLVGEHQREIATWSLVAEGGAGIAWLMPYLRGAGAECIPVDPRARAPAPDLDIHLVGSFGGGLRTRCRLETPGRQTTSNNDPIQRVPGPYSLEIRAWSWHNAPGLVDVDLVDIEAQGIEPLATHLTDPRAHVRLAMAEGQFEQVRNALSGTSDPESLALQARSSSALGEPALARSLAARVMSRSGHERKTWFATLERSQVDALREGARSAPDTVALLHSTYDTPLAMHPGDESLEAVWASLPPTFRDSTVEVDRAEALFRRGQRAAAEASLAAAWRLRPSAALHPRLHLMAARLATTPDARLAALRQALASSPIPEVVADRIVADPTFSDLANVPEFTDLMQVRYGPR
jgi:serine/threonine protein kinase